MLLYYDDSALNFQAVSLTQLNAFLYKSRVVMESLYSNRTLIKTQGRETAGIIKAFKMSNEWKSLTSGRGEDKAYTEHADKSEDSLSSGEKKVEDSGLARFQS